MPTVGPRKTRRTNRRLARIRLQNPKGVPNIKADNRYTPREVRRVKKVDARMRARQAKRKAAKQYNPLAPLTGPREKAEMNAATRLQFAPKERELRQAEGNLAQTTANRATYYDDYRQALREASARVNEANRQNVEATESRVDSSYTQDKAGVAARDAEASAAAAKLGRGPVTSQEGSQAVEAQRSQGNQAAASLRERAASDTKYTELRTANAALGKIEDQRRLAAKGDALRKEGRQLAGDKGAFKVDFRNKSRKDEREYSILKKEFGLKEKDLAIKSKSSRADRKLERQKLQAQKIVARIYANADKAGARAQIRVAKINLNKGKISQKQYREIVNIYKGLPKKGKPGAPGTGGTSSPAKKPLSVSEEKTVKKAFNRLSGVTPPIQLRDRKKAVDQLIGKYGYPPRVAREAWNRYARKAPGSNYNGPH